MPVDFKFYISGFFPIHTKVRINSKYQLRRLHLSGQIWVYSCCTVYSYTAEQFESLEHQTRTRSARFTVQNTLDATLYARLADTMLNANAKFARKRSAVKIQALKTRKWRKKDQLAPEFLWSKCRKTVLWRHRWANDRIKQWQVTGLSVINTIKTKTFSGEFCNQRLPSFLSQNSITQYVNRMPERRPTQSWNWQENPRVFAHTIRESRRVAVYSRRKTRGVWNRSGAGARRSWKA